LEIRAATAVELVRLISEVASADAQPKPAAELEYAKVIHAWPERRFSAVPAHVGRSTTCMAVSRYSKRVLEEGKVEVDMESVQATLDARKLCSPDVFKALHCWRPEHADPKLQLRPGVLDKVQQDMSQLVLPLQGDPGDEQGLEPDIQMSQYRQQALQLASWMLSVEAVAHLPGKFMTALDLMLHGPDHAADDLHELVRRDIVVERLDDMGTLTYALSSSAVSWSSQAAIGDLKLDTAKASSVRWQERTKLEAIVALLLDGWQAHGGAHLLPLQEDSEKRFLATNIKRSRWYFVALLKLQDIFSRGVTAVHHDMPWAYYQLLCDGTEEQVGRLLELEVKRCSLHHFLALLNGRPLPDLLDIGGVPVIAQQEEESWEEQGFEDGVAAPPGFEGVPLVLEGPLEIAPHDFELDVRRNAGSPMCRVRFDNASHVNGIQRAYIKCPWGHSRCFKYKQVNLIPDQDRMVAWLYTWALMGQDMTKEQHRDVAVPSDAAVEEMMAGLAM
jgi:hypothetical protein